MVNVDCSGGQDRNTTTSETHPRIPPPKTKNCYKTDDFNRDSCGTNDDGACITKGGSSSCIPDDYGGYCKDELKYFISAGPTWRELKGDDLLNRYKSASSTDQRVRSALSDQERRMNNRIRELQIMGKDPILEKSNDDDDDNEVHNSVTTILFNVGMGASVFMFLIPLSLIMIHKKII
jgi:hypothetical protein